MQVAGLAGPDIEHRQIGVGAVNPQASVEDGVEERLVTSTGLLPRRLGTLALVQPGKKCMEIGILFAKVSDFDLDLPSSAVKNSTFCWASFGLVPGSVRIKTGDDTSECLSQNQRDEIK